MQDEKMNLLIDMSTCKLKIEAIVLDNIMSYRQINPSDTEAGGILVGRVNKGSGNIIIEYCSNPLPEDKRTRLSFLRKDKRHIEFYTKLNEESKGIYAYMGEWHTHPEDYPNYSSIDLKNWKSIAKKMRISGKEYIHIIVGRKSFGVWCYSETAKRVVKLYEE